ncbi:MAG TPA: alkaline phosphatase family protein [Thermoanaerobaculia bacterium]|nr:alkaline phosphatase family protein [Thermoanaerobaculia bacterium]
MARPGWIDTLLAGLAPGVLLGTHVAGLIFFLNPHLPFSPGPVARGVLVYGGIVGLASLALHLPFTARQPGRARRWLPWALTLALAAAAWLDASHASFYAFYLPAGINDRLVRTAAWLALFALISFYTALLHTLHRRRYGWKSRYGYVLLAVLSVFAMIERREAFHARPAPVYRPAMVESGQRPVLFVVGIDSATLDALLPLAGQGRLPFLASALQQGAYGRLESLQPAWREGVWITLATGKYPFKHGVTGGKVYDAGWITTEGPSAELRLLPEGIRFRDWGTLGAEPHTPRAFPRQASALWEILPRLGMSAGSVSWPASWQPSRETEFTLPEQFFSGKPRPAVLGAVQRSQLGPNPPAYLVNAVTADVWRESLALSLFDQHPGTGALFVILPGLREVSRQTFGGFQAVQFEGEQSPAARAAAERLAAYYALLDSFLGELWLRVDGPRVLAVVSAYGTESREDPLRRERTAVEGSFGGAPDGVLLLYGEGIQPGALLTGARLVDVAPTLLYALGFPVAQDLDGQVIRAAFDKRFLASNPLTILPSYEGLAKQ